MITYSALKWKFNSVTGIVLVDGKVKQWPKSLGVQPTNEQLDKWQKEYIVYLDNNKLQKQESIKIEAKKQSELSENLSSLEQASKGIETVKTNIKEAKTVEEMKSITIDLVDIVETVTKLIYFVAHQKI